MEKIIIAAVSKNGVIGNEGKIPWNSKAELQHFKKTTNGFPIIMGRKTWDAIGTPLKNRTNIVISRSIKNQKKHENHFIIPSINKALKFVESLNAQKCYIIGGAQIYKAAFRYVDKIIISEMNFEVNGDTKFPDFKKKDWKKIACEELKEFTIHTFIRKEKL